MFNPQPNIFKHIYKIVVIENSIKTLVCGVAFICKPVNWFTVEIYFLVSIRNPHKELIGFTYVLNADHDLLFPEPANTKLEYMDQQSTL